MANRTITSVLRAETGQYERDMDRAAKASERVGEKGAEAGQKASKGMSGLLQEAEKNKQAWTQVGGTLAAFGVTLTGLTALTLKAGIEYNTLQQQTRAALTTLTGSAEAANEQMDKMDAFARTSPFSKATFLQAQQQLLGFGLEAQKVVPYLDAIQNAVAAFGGSNQQISEIAFVLAQISAAGKITATDLMQLGQRGIDAASIIGEQMGKAGAAIREDITDGALDANDALDALVMGMAERYDGAAEGVKGTFVGAIDRVKAAWRDLAADIAAPLVSPDGGGILIDLTNTFADTLRMVQALPAPVKTAVASIAGLGGVASLAAGSFLLLVPRIMETRNALKEMGPLANNVAKGLGAVGKAAGIAGAAVALIAVGDRLQRQFEGIEASSSAVTLSLLDLADARPGATLGADFDSLSESMTRLTDKNWAQSLQDNIYGALPILGSDSRVDEAVAQFEALDASLAGLASSGNADQAAAAHRALVRELGLGADEVDRLDELLPSYSEALGDQDVATRLASESAGELADEYARIVESVDNSREAARKGATAWSLFGASVNDAKVSLNQWLTEQEKTIEAMRNFRANADRALEKGLTEGIVLELQAMGEEGALRMKQLADASEEQIDRANDAWRGYGEEVSAQVDFFGGAVRTMEEDILGLADLIDDLPPEVVTHVKTNGVPRSLEEIDEIQEAYGLTPNQVQTLVTLSKAAAERDIHNLNALLNRVTKPRTIEILTRTLNNPVPRPGGSGNAIYDGLGGARRASGGPVFGPGTSTSDSIPIMVSNSEHVLSAREVQGLGGHGAVAEMRALARSASRSTSVGVSASPRTVPAPARSYAAPQSVTLDPSALDGLAITGTFEIGGDGLGRIIDGRINAAGAALVPSIRAGGGR